MTDKKFDPHINCSWTFLCFDKIDSLVSSFEIALQLFTNEAKMAIRLRTAEPPNVSMLLNWLHWTASTNKLSTSFDKDRAKISLALIDGMQMLKMSPKEHIEGCERVRKLMLQQLTDKYVLSISERSTPSMVQATSSVSNSLIIISDNLSCVLSNGLPSIKARNNDDAHEETENDFCDTRVFPSQ